MSHNIPFSLTCRLTLACDTEPRIRTGAHTSIVIFDSEGFTLTGN